MKSILHLKDDTEYQIPLREDGTEDRVKAGGAQKEVSGQENKEDKNNQLKDDPAIAKEHKNQMDDIAREEVDDKDDPALDNLEEENPNQEHSNIENSSDTTTDGVPPADTAKAALDEMKKLASQEGVIHPSLFISNFSKILGLMERAMQLQVEESGSVTKESDSATEEKAPKATEPATEQTETLEKTEVPEQAEAPAEG